MISDNSNFFSTISIGELCNFYWELFLFLSLDIFEAEGLLTFFESVSEDSTFFFNYFFGLSAFLLFSDFFGLLVKFLLDFLAELASFLEFLGIDFS